MTRRSATARLLPPSVFSLTLCVVLLSGWEGDSAPPVSAGPKATPQQTAMTELPVCARQPARVGMLVARSGWIGRKGVARVRRRIAQDRYPHRSCVRGLRSSPERLLDFLSTAVSQREPMVCVFEAIEAHSVVTNDAGVDDAAVVLRYSGEEFAR